MARPKRQHERRAQLVEIARQLVVERGVVALRLTDVAKRAGLSPASVLYYFSALSELLKEFEKEGEGGKTSPESEGFFARVKEFFEDLRE